MFNFKKNPLICGTLLLSFSGLICRGIGFFYRLFISQAFGEEAMGIFQLTSPILMLAYSLTCSGIQSALSRHVASCVGIKNETLAKKHLITGCLLSLCLSLLYSIIIYGQAENISIYILKEHRCATLLRICSLSFPFAAVHSCFNGYYYGKKNTQIPSFTQIVEQLVRVSSVFLLYHYFLKQQSTPSIALTCIGMFLGELVSFLISLLYFLTFDNRHNKPSINPSLCEYKTSHHSPHVLRQLLSLAIPLTFNRVIVNLLQSYEAVSIPLKLQQFGYSASSALSIYGVLTGMALSLLLFPSTFVNSASVLLLPAVSEAHSQENMERVRKTIKQAVFFSLTLGLCCTCFFYVCGDFCGQLMFDSSLAGSFIQTLSFLCPFLYLHGTLGSILNGLKKIKATLIINIMSLFLRLFFILYFIPIYGIKGYLWGLLLSEVFSAFLCLYLLFKNYFISDGTRKEQ